MANGKYVMGLNLDEPLARIDNSGSVHYYHADIIGSIVALTNSSAEVTTRYNYSPFGKTAIIGNDVSNPFRFTGREWDEETGLYYYRSRYYSPDMGRFISEDPIRFKSGQVNWYAYVGNNPINMVDPLGLLSWTELMSNYMFGDGKDMVTNICDIYPEEGFTLDDFCKDGEIVPLLTYDTNGPHGSVDFYLDEFGKIRALPNDWDFDHKPWGVRDPEGFPYPKEVSTRIGSHIPGDPFTVYFIGSIKPGENPCVK
jgi:RHS repeat-associated protein